jgi:hypothetical protein
MVRAVTNVVPESFLACSPALAGMGELEELHLTRMAWWCLGLLAYAAWAISVILEGDGLVTLVVAPFLVSLWVSAVIAIDRWVGKGVDEASYEPKPRR